MTWAETQRDLASSLTDEDFRKAGFTGHARNHPRSERGFLWLCQWNGIKPELAPPTWRFASNAYMLDYCEQQAASPAPELHRTAHVVPITFRARTCT